MFPQLPITPQHADNHQIYRTDDKPLYRRGNKILIAIACYNVVLFIFAKVFYVTVNK